jgi:hypothetical protein
MLNLIQKNRRREARNNLVRINKYTVMGAINEKYESTEEINMLINTIYTNNIEPIKNIRNEIMHQRSAGATITVSFDNMFISGYNMSVNNSGWIEFETMDREVEKCIKSIRCCFDAIYQIIKHNAYPNRIENAGKEYFVGIVTCSICKSKYSVSEFMLGENNKFIDIMICPYCGKVGCKVDEKKKVTEIDYGTTFGDHIRRIEELHKDVE